MSAATRPASWTSFHLFLPEPLEPFLAGHLHPALADGLGGRARRFFFIRYGEGGLHLRLRFRLREGADAEPLREALERCARAYLEERGGGGSARLERHPYDRAALYFGETAETVYSELLNEATSWLALRLLGAPGAGEWARRWLAAAATLHLLQRLSTADEAGYRAALRASLAFARRAAEELGFGAAEGEEDGGGEGREGLDAALAAACRRADVALARDAEARRTAALLRRLRRRPGGDEGAAHALHLFCNKLGFSLGDEQRILGSLLRLAQGEPTPARRP